jgi:hypothetical protein
MVPFGSEGGCSDEVEIVGIAQISPCDWPAANEFAAGRRGHADPASSFGNRTRL